MYEVLKDLYEGTGIEIVDDAEVVGNFAIEAGFDTSSSQQNLSMAALLIRENQLLREKIEKVTGRESRRSKERESGESRRSKERESGEKKKRSRSRRDQSVEKRSKRPPSRQVKKSSSEED